MQDHSITIPSPRAIGRPPVPLAVRFWHQVRKTDTCWLWIGSTNKWGYGKITQTGHHGRCLATHRVSWELHNGQIPPGLWVLHTCDANYAPGDETYRRCVNPAHLYLGTHADNTRDAMERNRVATGDRNGMRVHPDSRLRGDKHPSHLHPERWAKGERAGAAKLTAQQVATIRAEYAAKTTGPLSLAVRYGVAESTIFRIVRRKTWRD